MNVTSHLWFQHLWLIGCRVGSGGRVISTELNFTSRIWKKIEYIQTLLLIERVIWKMLYSDITNSSIIKEKKNNKTSI